MPERALSRQREEGSVDQERMVTTTCSCHCGGRCLVNVHPGVVGIPQGAWFDPDEKGIDQAGSANVLTKDEHSPGGALASDTCFVQVEKVSA